MFETDPGCAAALPFIRQKLDIITCHPRDCRRRWVRNDLKAPRGGVPFPLLMRRPKYAHDSLLSTVK